MSANEQSKQESFDNLSQSSSQEEPQKKQYKTHRLGNRKQPLNQNLIVKEQTSSREERKLKQYLQRIEEQQKQEEAAQLKRKKSKPNPETKPVETLEVQKINDEPIVPLPAPAPVLLNPQLVPQQSFQQPEGTAQTKLRFNPKLKMKEKHHIFLYLSDCYDKCTDNVQKLNSTATQLYSPSKVPKSDASNLLPINQDVYQETLLLIKNFKNQFQSSNDSLHQVNGIEQREFIHKYLDKKYLETVLRESKLQIYKKSGSEKLITPNGKFIQKKY